MVAACSSRGFMMFVCKRQACGILQCFCSQFRAKKGSRGRAGNSTELREPCGKVMHVHSFQGLPPLDHVAKLETSQGARAVLAHAKKRTTTSFATLHAQILELSPEAWPEG